MKTFYLTILLFTISASVFSQNEYNIKAHIQNSLKRFESMLSYLNSEDEPIEPRTISTYFGGATAFTVNSSRITLEDFIVYYQSKILGNKCFIHSFDFSTNSIEKSTKGEKLYNVNIFLHRSPDYQVRNVEFADEKMTMEVLYNGSDKEVTLLSLNFNLVPKEIKIEHGVSYTFLSDEKYITIPRKGGSWKFNITSLKNNIERKNINGGQSRVTSTDLVPFKYTSGDLKLDKRGQTISGSLYKNRNRYARRYNLQFTQDESNKTLEVVITQPTSINSYYFGRGFRRLALHYSPKYHMGFSFNFKFEDSSAEMGLLFMANFNTFRYQYEYIKHNEENSTSTYYANGYRIVNQSYLPELDDHNNVLNGHGETKDYSERQQLFFNVGLDATHFLNFSLGVGVTNYRARYFFPVLYSKDTYDYIPLSNGLSEIESVTAYTPKGKNFLLNGKYNFRFAIHPAISFFIPFNRELSLILGGGYTKVFNLKDADSFDISLGFSWEI